MGELELRKLALEFAIKYAEKNPTDNILNIASMFYTFLIGEKLIKLPEECVS